MNAFFALVVREAHLDPLPLIARLEEGFLFICDEQHRGILVVYAVCGEPDKAIAQCEAASRMNPLASKKAATSTS